MAMKWHDFFGDNHQGQRALLFRIRDHLTKLPRIRNDQLESERSEIVSAKTKQKKER
jgi:hypothetical protein